MNIKEIISYLDNLIKNDEELSDETKRVLYEVLKKLKAAKTTQQIMDALKWIATLLGIASEFLK